MNLARKITGVMVFILACIQHSMAIPMSGGIVPAERINDPYNGNHVCASGGDGGSAVAFIMELQDPPTVISLQAPAPPVRKESSCGGNVALGKKDPNGKSGHAPLGGQTTTGDNTAGSPDTTVDPIYIASGVVRHDEIDLGIPCPGMDLVLQRTYLSSDRDAVGMGQQWHHSFDWRTEQNTQIDVPDYVTPTNVVHAQASIAQAIEQHATTLTLDTTGRIRSRSNETFLVMQALADPFQSLYEGKVHSFHRRADGSFDSYTHYRVLPPFGTHTNIALGDLTHQFDTNGTLKRIVHASGAYIDLTYDAAVITNAYGLKRPRLVRVEHRNGMFFQFVYTGQNITRVETPDPSVYVDYLYDDDQDLVEVHRHTQRGVDTTFYRYQRVFLKGTKMATFVGNPPDAGWVRLYSTHRLCERTDSDGETFYYEYQAGDAESAEDLSQPPPAVRNYGDGGAYDTTLAFSGVNHSRLTERRSGRDLVTDYFYEPVTKQMQLVQGPNNTNWVTLKGYSERLDAVAIRVDDGDTGHFLIASNEYNEAHYPLRSGFGYDQDPDVFWCMTWDDTLHLPTSATDPLGLQIRATYSNGHLTALSYPFKAAFVTNIFAYGTNGLLTSATDAKGRTVQLEYTGNEYLRRIIPPLPPAIDFERGPLGQVTEVTLPWTNGTTRSFRFEVDDRSAPLHVEYPDGRTASMTYDGFGRMRSVQDPAGRTTTLDYVLGKFVASHRTLSDDTDYGIGVAHDNFMNAVHVTDPLGRPVETYVLDDASRIVAVTNLEGQTLTLSYQVAGFVDRIQRFDGSEVSLTYQSLGLPSEIRVGGLTNAFTYRANGQPVSASNEYGGVTWSYDAAGVAVTEDQGGYTVAYDYDESGNATSAVSVAGTTTASLDDLDRLTDLRTPAGDFGWRYSATNGLVSEVAYPNGIVASYAFDVTDRMRELTYRNATGGVVRSMGYSYNNLDLITRVEREDGSSRDYGYDELDQLASEEHRDVSNALTYAHTLGYDLAGNRTQTVRNAQTNVWTLGQGNRLASWGLGTAAEYDAAGCTTSLVYAGGTRLDLTWNDRYQLLNVRKDGVEVESYTYDALGRRLSTSNAAGLVRHVYDGPHVIADVDPEGRPLRTYAYGPGIDNVLSMTVHGTTTNAYYYLKDHLGSVLALTDDEGDVVESYEYDAWGQASVYDSSGAPLTESAFGNRYGFQGREQSWITGLIYFRARWYDSITGRWLSKDPIGISGGLNQYVFCGNIPVNLIDPFGLTSKEHKVIIVSEWTISGDLRTHELQAKYSGSDVYSVASRVQVLAILRGYAQHGGQITELTLSSHRPTDGLGLGVKGDNFLLESLSEDESKLISDVMAPGAIITITGCYQARERIDEMHLVADRYGVDVCGFTGQYGYGSPSTLGTIGSQLVNMYEGRESGKWIIAKPSK